MKDPFLQSAPDFDILRLRALQAFCSRLSGRERIPLKSGLRLRPVFHWAPWRIQAHVTIFVLALLLERIAEVRATDTWRNVRAELERIQVVEHEHGDARVQQTTELRSEAATLLRNLGVAAPPRLHAIDPLPGVEASA